MQAYAFAVSCLLHRDANTSISALEALHQLLLFPTPHLSTWLTSPLTLSHPPTDYWAKSSEPDAISDTHSQISEVGHMISEVGHMISEVGHMTILFFFLQGLETPCDIYFDNEQELTLSFTAAGKPTTRMSHVTANASATGDSEASPTHPPAAISISACMPVPEGPPEPLNNLVKVETCHCLYMLSYELHINPPTIEQVICSSVIDKLFHPHFLFHSPFPSSTSVMLFSSILE